MRTGLDHLPHRKQRELEQVVRIVFEEFEDALGHATQAWKKKGRISKIVLYGSYARGGWIDEPHTAKGYRSDFDLLIIVNDRRLTDRADYWYRLDERLIRELAVDRTLHTPVNFIVHTMQEVNDGLAEGRYFFMDVARDGIALYQSDNRKFAEPKPRTPQAALDMAREYFEEWYPAAIKRFDIAKFDLEKGYLKDAAFDLHQTVERLYHCVLLVRTFYTPHSHNIDFLRTQAERIDQRLIEAWPRETRAERARFTKLRDAYVKARYSKHYSITEEELAWLGERVEMLAGIVETVCAERIAALEAAAAG